VSIQVVNHLPIAKKTYTEKAASKFQISPLDGAQYESILANNIQRSNKEERYTRENTTRLRPRKNTPTQIHTNSVKNIKIQHQFKSSSENMKLRPAWAAAGKTEWQETTLWSYSSLYDEISTY
jgi:hypothetical protein